MREFIKSNLGTFLLYILGHALVGMLCVFIIYAITVKMSETFGFLTFSILGILWVVSLVVMGVELEIFNT